MRAVCCHVILAFWTLTSPLAAHAAAGASAVGPPPAATAATITNALIEPATNAVVVVKSHSARDAWLSFGLDKIPQLQTKVLGNPLWQYVASIIYILLAFYLSKLLDNFLQQQLRHWTKKTETKLDEVMLDLVRGPVKVISFVILLHIGLRVFSWPAWGAAFISNGLKITVAASIAYVGIRFVDVLMGMWQQRVQAKGEVVMDIGLLPIIRKTLKIFVVVVAVLVTSQNLGMNITGLLASLSIGGLAVGLAAQDTLGNLFGAVAIFADKPFKVGDRIQVDAIDGTVEAIGLRSTRVRSLDDYLVSVPNKTMANANIINISKRSRIKTVMNIGVTYDTPSETVNRAAQIIREVFGSHPQTSELIVTFNRFDSSSLNIMVVHWWANTDFKAYFPGLQQMNLELKRRFDEERIDFAFPTQTIYMKQDSDWRVAQAGRIDDAARN